MVMGLPGTNLLEGLLSKSASAVVDPQTSWSGFGCAGLAVATSRHSRGIACSLGWETERLIPWFGAGAKPHQGSERLYDNQNDDEHHQKRRNLVPDAIELGGADVGITLEIFTPDAEQVVRDGQGEDEQELGLKPTVLIGRCEPCEGRAQHPNRNQCWIHDRAQQLALHYLESLRFQRARLCLSVIDKQAREIEEPAHPGDHGDHMERLDPVD